MHQYLKSNYIIILRCIVHSSHGHLKHTNNREILGISRKVVKLGKMYLWQIYILFWYLQNIFMIFSDLYLDKGTLSEEWSGLLMLMHYYLKSD